MCDSEKSQLAFYSTHPTKAMKDIQNFPEQTCQKEDIYSDTAMGIQNIQERKVTMLSHAGVPPYL